MDLLVFEGNAQAFPVFVFSFQFPFPVKTVRAVCAVTFHSDIVH